MQKKIRTLIIAGALLASGSLVGTTASAGELSDTMLANTCAGCHGTNGHAAGPSMPIISGLDKTYMNDVLMAFKSGDAESTIMGRIIKGYSDSEIARISAFFAKQKWMSSNSKVDQAQVKKGKKLAKKCEKCHEDGGKVQEEALPRIGGQWLDYLTIQMENYKDPNWKMPMDKKMRRAVDKKSIEELKAIAQFYASQK